jgi:hypothetical protein
VVQPTPDIKGPIVAGTLIYTDEYSIYSPLSKWGYDHKSVCHVKGEYARSGGWRWILRSTCEYDGRLLVLTSVLVQATPRNFLREVTPVFGQLHRLFTTLENEAKHYFQLFWDVSSSRSLESIKSLKVLAFAQQ